MTRTFSGANMALLLKIGPAMADQLAGQTSVIDGDTLEIHGTRVRLWGIDAPESTQLCRGEDSNQYRWGAQAANDLDSFIARRSVLCATINLDQYGRTDARSRPARWTGRIWANGWCVMALRWIGLNIPKRSMTLCSAKPNTRDAAMWKGSYVEPWLYRAYTPLASRST
jgi:endonuclease YncB( thermonuclease family)